MPSEAQGCGRRSGLNVGDMTMTANISVELATIAGTGLAVSRVGLGTWAIGGWMWGGTDDAQSIKTIHAAVDRGINLIDTAPAYGFGRSEEIVGRAIADGGLRSQVVIATKTGLEWKDGNVFRNASRDRILREVEDSLRRLQTDYIDIYQVHWPDPLVPIEETAAAMQTLYDQGRFAPSGSAISRSKKSSAFAVSPSCTPFSRLTICSSVRSRPSCCPIAGNRTSPP